MKEKIFYYKEDAKKAAEKEAYYINGSVSSRTGVLTSDNAPDTDEIFDEKCGSWSGETAAFKVLDTKGDLYALYGYWTDDEKLTKEMAVENIVSHLQDDDSIPAYFAGEGGTGYELMTGDPEAIKKDLEEADYELLEDTPEEFNGEGLDLNDYQAAVRFDYPDGLTAYYLLWDID